MRTDRRTRSLAKVRRRKDKVMPNRQNYLFCDMILSESDVCEICDGDVCIFFMERGFEGKKSRRRRLEMDSRNERID
ncbi:hypothetical protein VIGAN_02112300, partial [Vigna angularis var. angularis]